VVLRPSWSKICLIAVEAEFPDGVVLMLQGYVPFPHDLRGIPVLAQLTGETRLRRTQVEILLMLAVQDDLEPVLERIPAGQQLGA
jgi:hypothetical protein